MNKSTEQVNPISKVAKSYIALPNRLAKRLDETAEKQFTNRTAIVRQLVLVYLAKQDRLDPDPSYDDAS